MIDYTAMLEKERAMNRTEIFHQGQQHSCKKGNERRRKRKRRIGEEHGKGMKKELGHRSLLTTRDI